MSPLFVHLAAGTATSTTPATLADHLPTARPRHYPSDASDAERAILAPHVPAGTGRGRSNAEIGRELHISEATVKTHLLRTFDKLGVSDRTPAVTTAMSRGLLPRDLGRRAADRRHATPLRRGILGTTAPVQSHLASIEE